MGWESELEEKIDGLFVKEAERIYHARELLKTTHSPQEIFPGAFEFERYLEIKGCEERVQAYITILETTQPHAPLLAKMQSVLAKIKIYTDRETIRWSEYVESRAIPANERMREINGRNTKL